MSYQGIRSSNQTPKGSDGTTNFATPQNVMANQVLENKANYGSTGRVNMKTRVHKAPSTSHHSKERSPAGDSLVDSQIAKQKYMNHSK